MISRIFSFMSERKRLSQSINIIDKGLKFSSKILHQFKFKFYI